MIGFGGKEILGLCGYLKVILGFSGDFQDFLWRFPHP